MSKRKKFPGKAKVIPERDDLFLPSQAKWIRDESRLKLMEKCRQIGISWSTAYGLVRRKSLEDAAVDGWVSSRDDIQARLFLEDCKAFSTILNAGAIDLGEVVIDEKDKITAYVLKFANGRRIHSMSSNPDAQAGKRGDRVLDEFALHPDPRKLYQIAYPGITWGGSMEIISTHRGSFNFFNQLVIEIKEKGNPKGISLHTVTLQNALDEGFLYKLQSKLPQDDERQDMDEVEYYNFIKSGCPDDETFEQEFNCNPADDATTFLSYDLIDSCKYRPGVDWEKDLEDLKGELYVGVDVGRKKDLTVIWVNEKLGDVAYARKVIELEKVRFKEQEEILYPILELPQMRRCCIDASGMGMQFAERAQERYGEYKVEDITMTNNVKAELAYPTKASFEDKTLRIPDDRIITSDLRKVKKTTTASGNIRFEAESDDEGHADRFWALALALHAGKNPTGPFQYSTISRDQISGPERRSLRRRGVLL